MNKLLAGLLGGVGGLVGSSFLKDPANPADAAMPYLEGVPAMAKGYLEPYTEAGERGLGRAEEQYGQLLDDPSALINQLMQSYQESPNYQYMMDNAMRGANVAAATGGSLGTPGHQYYGAQMASDLAQQGMGDYLGQALGLYQTGLGGEQTLANMGLQGAGGLSSLLASNALNEAGLAFQGKSQQEQAKMDRLGMLLKGVGAGAKFLMPPTPTPTL